MSNKLNISRQNNTHQDSSAQDDNTREIVHADGVDEAVIQLNHTSQATDCQNNDSKETTDEDTSGDEEMDLAALRHGQLVSDTSSDENWVAKFKTENGRTYHSYSDGKYWGSNDSLAQDEELMCHELWSSTFGRHLICPTNRNLQQILDLGTGTGLWASQLAINNPRSIVTGLDLSPIQPVYEAHNLHFVIDDVEKDFTCQEESQDLIHIRGLDGSIGDWSRLYAQCYRSLRPGGIIEHAECSHLFTSPDNNTTGREIQAIERSEDRMIHTGFDGIRTKYARWPLWCQTDDRQYQRIASQAKALIDDGLEDWALRRFTRDVGWDMNEVMMLCASVRQQLAWPSVHACLEVKVVYAIKPCHYTGELSDPTMEEVENEEPFPPWVVDV